MIGKTSILSAFNSFQVFEDTGKVRFFAEDGTSATIRYAEQANFLTAEGRVPKIYTDLYISAPNDSVCKNETTGDVFFREDDKWKLVLKNDFDKNIFRIDYYDENLEYQENSVVGYEGLKFAATEDVQAGVAPLSETSDLSLTGSELFSNNDIFGITGLEYINGYRSLVASSTQGIYRINKDGVVGEETRYSPPGQMKEIVVFGLKFYTEESVLKMTDLDHEIEDKEIDIGSNIVSIAEVDGRIAVATSDRKVLFVDTNLMTIDDDVVDVGADISQITGSSAELLIVMNDDTARILNIKKMDLSDSIQIDSSKIYAIDNRNNLYYVDGLAIRKKKMNQSPWRVITTEDIFAIDDECIMSYVKILTHINIVDDSKYNYKVYDFNPIGFCFTGSKYVSIASDKLNGETYIYDISNGVFNNVYERSIVPGDIVTALASFQGDLILFCGLVAKIYDAYTLEYKRQIDLQDILEDYGVMSASARGDTLYLLTTNGKVYMFDDIDSDQSGIIALQNYTSKTKISIIDSSRMYASSIFPGDSEIYEVSVNDGTMLAKTSLDRKLDTDIDIRYNSMYVMDLEGRYLMTKYRTKEILKLEV